MVPPSSDKPESRALVVSGNVAPEPEVELDGKGANTYPAQRVF
jgi:hypothetical protein